MIALIEQTWSYWKILISDWVMTKQFVKNTKYSINVHIFFKRTQGTIINRLSMWNHNYSACIKIFGRKMGVVTLLAPMGLGAQNFTEKLVHCIDLSVQQLPQNLFSWHQHTRTMLDNGYDNWYKVTWKAADLFLISRNRQDFFRGIRWKSSFLLFLAEELPDAFYWIKNIVPTQSYHIMKFWTYVPEL